MGKKTGWMTGTVSAGILVLTTVTAGALAAEVNRIVLRVNDRIATLYDYEQLKQERVRMLSRQGLSEEDKQRRLAQAGLETMQEMFEEMLLMSRADQLEVRVAPSELQQALEQTKANFGIKTEEEFEQALAASGMTREVLRKQVENSMRMRELFGIEVYPEVSLEEEDLRRYYGTHPDEFRQTEAVRLREVVLLESAEAAGQAASELADRVREALDLGTGDELIAELESEGLSTGWIELGWVVAGDLDPQLEAAVQSLSVGETSEATEARGGLHMIQVLERREADLKSFAEVRDAIEATERERRFQERLAEYMRELEDAAYIVASPPPDAAGFRTRQAPLAPSPSSRDAVPEDAANSDRS